MGRNFTPDQELIDRLLLNDTSAFEELYRRYWQSLYTYSAKKLRSSDEARKIVRGIFIELWEDRQTIPVNFSISQHLYSAVRLAVVESLKERLSNIAEEELMQEEILGSFTVKALEPSRQPVLAKEPVTEATHNRASFDELHPGYSPYKVNWFSQFLNTSQQNN